MVYRGGVLMSLNEYRISLLDDTHRLKSSLKGMTFSEKGVDSALEQFDTLRYSQFTVIPSPFGTIEEDELKEGESQYSVFIPLDRNRLTLLDSIWFYPVVLWIVYETTLWYWGLSFELLSNLTILQWYFPFYKGIINALSLFMNDNFANAFGLMIPFSTFIELSIVCPLYLVLKLVLSWLPSKIWYYLLMIFTDVRR